MNNKELKKMVEDIVTDTIQMIKDDNVIYMYEPTLETSKASDCARLNVYIEHHKAHIDESYIVDTIMENFKQ
tara:strand:- start:406 stop:621 length:216 start_codon:yes stop_codon:yes gene_type:complete